MIIQELNNKYFEEMLQRTNENTIQKVLNYIKSNGGITSEQNNLLLNRFHEKKNEGKEFCNIIERTILIMANEGLCGYIVSRQFGYDQDLCSVAKYGLIKAVDTYSFDKDTTFATYATRVIINEILMYKRREKSKIEAKIFVGSLNDVICDAEKDNDINSLSNMLRDDEDFVEKIVEKDYCKYIQTLFKYLTPNEQKVMIYGFGLFNQPVLNQTQIAQKLNISQANVSRMLNIVPQKLYLLLNQDKIEDEKQMKKLMGKEYPLMFS